MGTSSRAIATSHGHLSELCPLSRNVQRLWMHGTAHKAKPRLNTMPMLQIPRRSFGIEIESIVTKTQQHQTFSDILHSLSLGEDAGSWNLVEDNSIESEGLHIERI